MKRATLAAAAVGVVVIGLGVAAPAQAAEVEIVPHHEVGSEAWTYCPTDVVPFDVVHTWDVMVRDRNTLRNGLWQLADNGHGTESWAANGHVFTDQRTWNNRDTHVTDNGDGTLTIERRASYSSAYTLDGSFLFRDAGSVAGSFMVDTMGTQYPDDDEFLRVVDDFVNHGRTDTDGRDFCQDLALFLG